MICECAKPRVKYVMEETLQKQRDLIWSTRFDEVSSEILSEIFLTKFSLHRLPI